MKIQEMTGDFKQNHLQFVNGHTELLRANLRASAEQAQHYLLFALGGAVAAMLSLMGASKEIRQNITAFHALGCFLFGLFLCGAMTAANYQVALNQFEVWGNSVNAFMNGTTEHLAVVDNLNLAIKKWGRLPAIFGYGAFISFLVGSLMAFIGLAP